MEEVGQHLAVSEEEICTYRRCNPNPEDGITPEIQKCLNERKSDGKIDSWEGLWRCLFPDDLVIPEAGKIQDVLPLRDAAEELCLLCEYNSQEY